MSGARETSLSKLLDAVAPRAVIAAAAAAEIAGAGSLDAMFPDSPTAPAALLESTLPGARLGRWSFLIDRPRAVVALRRAARGTFVTLHPGEKEQPQSFLVRLRAVDVMMQILRRLRADMFNVPRSAPPFLGGLVGYFGYELLHDLERVPELPEDDLRLPDCVLLAADAVLGRDELSATTFAVALGRGQTPTAAHAAAQHGADELAARVTATAPARGSEVPSTPDNDLLSRESVPWRHSLTAAQHGAAVEVIRDRIARGDLYQMNLTMRLSAPCPAAPEALYRHLRRSNPAPFSALLRLPSFSVVCCSPERFLRLDPDGRVETRPIKGTRPRGDSPAADAARCEALRTSDKDRAEHAMIVDLLRNDLGRVCEYGSIRVAEMMALEPYASCWQMVSTVVGRLAPGRDAADVLRAAFPGGSMTGAPKIAAMKLIAELEPVRRGIYSGCLGYFDVRGGCDLNIVIRSLIHHAGVAHVHAGGGIVADSHPDAEFSEAMVKAGPLLRAVEAIRTPDRAAQPTPV